MELVVQNNITDYQLVITETGGLELVLMAVPELTLDVSNGLSGGGGSVDSVNGKVGIVVLDAADVGADISGAAATAQTNSETYTDTQVATKQNTLVSGTNIKTINSTSLLGSGNINIGGAVDSVNGQTGVVVLDADDVGAATKGFVIAMAAAL